MHCSTGIAGRTRSRTALTQKNDVVSQCSDDGRTQNHKLSREALTQKNNKNGAVFLGSYDDDDDDRTQQHKHSDSDSDSHSGSDIYIISDPDDKEKEGDADNDVDCRRSFDIAGKTSSGKALRKDAGALSSKDDQVDRPQEHKHSVSDEGEEEENEDGVKGRRSNEKWKRERSVEVGVKRRKAYGLDILINDNASKEKKCAAQRTRSHFRIRKKLKKGTITQPICVDEEDLSVSDSSSDEDAIESSDEEDSSSEGYETEGRVHWNQKPYGKNHFRDSNDFPMKICFSQEERTPEKTESVKDSVDLPRKFTFSREERTPVRTECVNNLDEIWSEMEFCLDYTECNNGPASEVGLVGEKSSEKKRCVSVVEYFGVFDSTQDSVHGKGEVKSNVDLEKLKFSFGMKEPEIEEQSDSEKELDSIWAEMEYGLHATPPDSVPASQVQYDADSDHDEYPKGELSRGTLCSQGKHHLILDEEIGLVCAYCLHVSLEIKYYVPPFGGSPWRKSNRRDSFSLDDVDHSVFDELQHQVAGHDDHSLSDYTGTVWELIPGVKQTMFPHQCQAFEFLWSNLAGGVFLDKLKEQKEFPGGCIISHAPGTGKTRLTIVFLQTFMELYPSCRPIIIAPKGMLLSWEEEFKIWKVDIPFLNLNLNKNSRFNASKRGTKARRLDKLNSWKRNKSILGISYKLFEQLTRQRSKDRVSRDALLEHTGLLVLDEGHTPRNSRSLIFQAVSRMRTKRRIILSGTPFQNNLDELHNTLCLARPNFVECNPSEDKWGHPGYENKGKWVYLTNSFNKATDDSRRFKLLKEIGNMIRPFVHVYNGITMKDRLPGLTKLLVVLRPTQLQKEIFGDIQKERKSQAQGKQCVMKLEYEESVTAVHPSLFSLFEAKKLRRLKLNPEEGVKTKFLMELIRLSGVLNEKVLVFSQHMRPLKLVASQIKHQFGWHEGVEMLQIHGKVDVKMRQTCIKAFNHPNSKARVMLASTRACCEGISLVGASRVVLLDIVWNPSVERQAISRAYRPGQKKIVYTYHLITDGTRDEEKVSRQTVKDQISESVFFDFDGARQCHKILAKSEFDDRILESMVEQEKFAHIFERVLG